MATAQLETTITEYDQVRREPNDILQSNQRAVRPTWAEVTRELSEMEALVTDWDGQGSEPPPPALLRRCQDFLLGLRAQSRDCPHSVRPTPDSCIVFQWIYDVVRVEAELSLNAVEWMEWHPGAPVSYRKSDWPL